MSQQHADITGGYGPRVIALQGGCNFRDMGGYQASDGQTIRLGRIYRSGVLTYLTARDREQLEEAGIRTVWDLRRKSEREAEPTHLTPQVSIRVRWLDDPVDGETVRRFGGGTGSASGTALMVEHYRAMPNLLRARLKAVLACLAKGDLPLIIHCAAGKDRTGFVAAVIHTILGLQWSDVVENYLRTNTAVDLEAFIAERHEAQMGLGDQSHPLLNKTEDVRKAMLRAEPLYLESAFKQIVEVYGSFDTYISAELGLSNADLEKIRSAMLH